MQLASEPKTTASRAPTNSFFVVFICTLLSGLLDERKSKTVQFKKINPLSTREPKKQRPEPTGAGLFDIACDHSLFTIRFIKPGDGFTCPTSR
jgi:hypothetical protein